mmetsp:Transcript_2361/g.3538  ORF Transcript_2361/g.3538 Transcript_2361/m.3538 type:complete len:277 (-) Transcript_2361:2-832(-)
MNHAKPSMDEGSSSKRQKTTSTSFHDEDKETWVLGVHTLMPYLQKKPEAYKGTILEDSKGMLPPYCICMGDTRRVRSTTKYFDEGSAVILNDRMLKANGNPGRITVAVGTYKGTPIVAFEHQMGSPAAEIIVREMVSNKIMTNEFKLGETVFNSDAKYVFRVGSAAGINCYNGPEEEKKQELRSPVVNAYDCIVASHQVGISCADYSAMTGSINSLSLSHVEEVKEKLKKMGYIFQNGWPVLRTDANTVKLLRSSIEAKLNAFNASRGEGQVVVCV